MKKLDGYLFSNTVEIDRLLIAGLSEGYFDLFLERHVIDKKELIQQIVQSQEREESVIQEVCTLGSEEVGIREMEGLSDDEKDYLNSCAFLDCGAGRTFQDNLFFASIENADRIAQPDRDSDSDRMAYAVGLLYRTVDGEIHCIMKSFFKVRRSRH